MASFPAQAGIQPVDFELVARGSRLSPGCDGRRQMPPLPALDVTPALPEIVLACAAMALLLLGVFRGEGSTRLVSWLSVAVLIGILVLTGIFGMQRRVGFYGMFVDRPLRRLHESAGAARLGGQHHHGAALQRGAPHRPLRVPGADLAGGHRHDGHGLGQRPDHALSRPRIAEPVALRRRQLRPRLGALDRGRAQVFRPRRARLGHAALRRLADLRLRRHHQLRRAGETASTAAARPRTG